MQLFKSRCLDWERQHCWLRNECYYGNKFLEDSGLSIKGASKTIEN